MKSGDLGKQDMKPEWLLEGIVCKTQITILYGKSKSGKTTFLASLASAIAEGKPFMGRTTKKANVLYWTFEESKETFSRRINQCGLSSDINLCFDRTKLTEDKQVELLRETIKQNCIELLIIDPAIRAFSFSDEWKQESVSKEFEPLLKLRDELKIAIIVLAHSNKSDSSVNGSVQFEASVDSIIHYQSSADNTSITLGIGGRLEVSQCKIKLKGTPDGKYEAVVSPSAPKAPQNTKPVLNANEQIILKLLASPKTKDELATESSKSESTVKSSLYSLEEKGLAVKQGKEGKADLWTKPTG